MARGTDFGGVHSAVDLNLIQQRVDVQPAEPKLNLVNIPGADGTKDMSELPGGRLVYKDRKVTWIFALYPGDSWDEKHRQVSNALNGKRCRITLDTDLDYYFLGRVVVKKYNRDKALRQITVEATCSPWIRKQYVTVHKKTLAASTAFTVLTLRNEKMPTVPTIEVTADATIRWRGTSATISAGSYTSLDIELQEGDNVLEVRTDASSCAVTITYQEGSL